MSTPKNRSAFPTSRSRFASGTRTRSARDEWHVQGTRRERRPCDDRGAGGHVRVSRRSAGSALASAMLVCAGAICCMPARATLDGRTSHAAHAASAPRTTADALGPPPAPGRYAPPPPTDGVVYRCGSNYSAQPCGSSRPLDVDDGRTVLQRLQGEDVAARDKRLATWLASQRQERDAVASAPRKSPAAAAKTCLPTRYLVCPKPRKPSQTASKAKLKTGSGAAFLPGN